MACDKWSQQPVVPFVLAQLPEQSCRAEEFTEMCAFPVVYNEEVRLGAVAGSCLSHIIDDPRLDRLTRLAAYVTGCPVSLITTVNTMVELNSMHGLLKARVPRRFSREMSICNYTILEQDIFVVEDTLLDSRFHDKASVIGYPFIRFYAGVPLVNAAAHRLGSLCVIDHAPRQLENSQLLALRDLGATVSELMKGIQAESEHARAPAKLP
ncbi:MAG: GAF domain-containing protein [Janthinobacterium lividum]